jgi:hypothetical protein
VAGTDWKEAQLFCQTAAAVIVTNAEYKIKIFNFDGLPIKT